METISQQAKRGRPLSPAMAKARVLVEYGMCVADAAEHAGIPNYCRPSLYSWARSQGIDALATPERLAKRTGVQTNKRCKTFYGKPRFKVGARYRLSFAIRPDLYEPFAAYAEARDISLCEAINQLVAVALEVK